MPGWLQPTQQLRLDLQEPQHHPGHHGGPPAGGAILQTGPGWGVLVSCLQQCDTKAGWGPVYSGCGQLRDRWVEGGTWVDFGNPLSLAHCKQCVMPKAEEAYMLLELYRDEDNCQLWEQLHISRLIADEKGRVNITWNYMAFLWNFYLCC